MEVADWADLFIMSLWHHVCFFFFYIFHSTHLVFLLSPLLSIQKWHVKEADKRIPEIQGVLELSVQRSSCEGDPYKERLFAYLKGDGMVHLSASATGIANIILSIMLIRWKLLISFSSFSPFM